MILDFKVAALSRGLRTHSCKTKILTNASQVGTNAVPTALTIDGDSYEILDRESSTKYLGRKVCFKEAQET